MTKAQKTFILKKLIPFVLREQGRGFGMSMWHPTLRPGKNIKIDGIERPVPECGTVACIGGSIEILSGNRAYSGEKAAKFIGLTPNQGYTLFYGWDGDSWPWPSEYVKAYAKAKKTIDKAKVAVALLKDVVKTNGKILDRK